MRQKKSRFFFIFDVGGLVKKKVARYRCKDIARSGSGREETSQRQVCRFTSFFFVHHALNPLIFTYFGDVTQVIRVSEIGDYYYWVNLEKKIVSNADDSTICPERQKKSCVDSIKHVTFFASHWQSLQPYDVSSIVFVRTIERYKIHREIHREARKAHTQTHAHTHTRTHASIHTDSGIPAWRSCFILIFRF